MRATRKESVSRESSLPELLKDVEPLTEPLLCGSQILSYQMYLSVINWY